MYDLTAALVPQTIATAIVAAAISGLLVGGVTAWRRPLARRRMVSTIIRSVLHIWLLAALVVLLTLSALLLPDLP